MRSSLDELVYKKSHCGHNDFHKNFILPSSNTGNLLMFKNLQNQFNLFTQLSKDILTKSAKNSVPTDQHQVLLVTVKDNTKREKSTMHTSYFS